ncbi:MAG: AzlD domain-containing protein [Tissierellia bacterium]|nr:AzlD domain-containing protein [Tissierellia bacterium]
MNSILLILLCALATVIPKIIPMKFLEDKEISMEVAEFLNIIPYTSLSILIIRGITSATKEMFLPTVIASLVAVIIAWTKESIGFTIIAGVFTAFIILYFR